jgi:uncharacterized protein YjbI with pentapeptide repeats
MSEDQGNPPEAEPYLALARRGKEVWNAWKREELKEPGLPDPKRPVNFAGVDFTKPENQDINFGGFEFGDHANFSKAKFGNTPNWMDDGYFQLPNGHPTKGGAYFNNAKFGFFATFSHAKFGGNASFENVTFGVMVNFSSAIFGARANFKKAKFYEMALFDSTSFDSFADFSKSEFKGTVMFNSKRNIESISREFGPIVTE